MDPRGEPGEERQDIERVYGRYRALVSDWASFADALRTPLDPIVWANPMRLDRGELAGLFREAGIESEPVAWEPTALRLAGVTRPGMHWGHWTGLYYVQEAASLVPVRLLDPKPGHRVLDLCAAPGSKTARLAIALENRGTLVANDRSVQRIAAVSAAIARLGLVNVTCTIADGASYPLEAGLFDRVLVDAPCSAEGNAFKNANWRKNDSAFRAYVAGTQRALLRRAARLCKPGGRIVYSTCTFAPEENEAVLDAVVRELDGALRVVRPAMRDGLATSAGIDAWEGHAFLPEVANAVRLWPHVSGTGGFFAAVLEKTASVAGEAADTPGAPVREAGIDPRASDVLMRFADAFGLGEDVFDGHRLLTSGRFARLVSDDHAMPIGPRHVSTGLAVTRNRAHGAKLSTAGALAFGRRATRRVVELDARGADAFEAREPIVLARAPRDAVRGYVIARTASHPLGLGLVREEDGRAVLHSEFPSAWSRTASGRSTAAD